MPTPRLTTKAACRVANIDRNRFNEHVHAGNYKCAPSTVAGRARLFDVHDLIGLKLFVQLMADGKVPETAGDIACQVADAAKRNPDAKIIAYARTYASSPIAMPVTELPPPAEWDGHLLSGCTIRTVDCFNVGQLRRIVEHGIEDERSIIGADDE